MRRAILLGHGIEPQTASVDVQQVTGGSVNQVRFLADVGASMRVIVIIQVSWEEGGRLNCTDKKLKW
jgi:hypothetical protein